MTLNLRPAFCIAALSLALNACERTSENPCDRRSSAGEKCVLPPPCIDETCEPCEGPDCEPVVSCDVLCDPCDARCDACAPTCAPALEGLLHAPITLAQPVAQSTESSRWQVDFSIDEGTPSWLLSAWVDGERFIVGDRLESDEGAYAMDWDSLADAVAVQQNVSPFFATLLMPPGPTYASLLHAGDHRATVDVEGVDAPLWQVVQQAAPMDEVARPWALRVRVVVASSKWSSEAEARADERLRFALETAASVYHDAGIALYISEWERLPTSVIEAMGPASSLGELQDFFASASVPLCTNAREELQVNLLLVDGFDEELRYLSGVTGALPGPVALHSAFPSGVAVSVLQLDQVTGPRTVGQLIAHELGHYMGLRHTSELDGARFDPMPDTAECATPMITANPRDCGDFGNVMFPNTYNRAEVLWSESQREQLRRHPAITQR